MDEYLGTSRAVEHPQGGLNSVKTFVADKLDEAAQGIRNKTAQGTVAEDGRAQVGTHAADWLEKASGSVRRFEPERVKENVQREMRQNPGRTLLIAAATGIVLGAFLRRR